MNAIHIILLVVIISSCICSWRLFHRIQWLCNEPEEWSEPQADAKFEEKSENCR